MAYTDTQILDWLEDGEHSLLPNGDTWVVFRLEPAQRCHNVFRGLTIRTVVQKAMHTPPFKGLLPTEFDALTLEDQLAANSPSILEETLDRLIAAHEQILEQEVTLDYIRQKRDELNTA